MQIIRKMKECIKSSKLRSILFYEYSPSDRKQVERPVAEDITIVTTIVTALFCWDIKTMTLMSSEHRFAFIILPRLTAILMSHQVLVLHSTSSSFRMWQTPCKNKEGSTIACTLNSVHRHAFPEVEGGGDGNKQSIRMFGIHEASRAGTLNGILPPVIRSIRTQMKPEWCTTSNKKYNTEQGEAAERSCYLSTKGHVPHFKHPIPNMRRARHIRPVGWC